MFLAIPSARGAAVGSFVSNTFKSAVLDLNFASTKSLIDSATGLNLVTFTRASSATYIDSAGTLQTAAVDVPRFDHNPTTGESLGLLPEEQRTNLLLNTATLSTQSVTVTAVAHTLSFYGSGTVTLSGASTAGPAVGSGAFPARTTLTFTPSAGTLTLTVTGSVTSAQLEAGAFATSYIPTTTAAATRSADVASITGANFSSWYRQDEGTVFAEWKCDPSTGSHWPNPAYFDDGTNNNYIGLQYRLPGAKTIRLNVVSGGVSSVSTTTNAYTPGQSGKTAAAFKVNDFGVVLAGSTVATSATGSMPLVTTARIGFETVSSSYFNGTIRRLTYWPQRLPNSTLQAITQ
jgi:hypothetical protein